mgnify:CR=1 FL=1
MVVHWDMYLVGCWVVQMADRSVERTAVHLADKKVDLMAFHWVD